MKQNNDLRKGRQKMRFLSILFLPGILFALWPLYSAGTMHTDTFIDRCAEVNNAAQEKPSVIYFVDGTATTAEEVDKLKPEEIEQMEFIQDPGEVRKYTDREVDTVVLITTTDKAKEADKK